MPTQSRPVLDAASQEPLAEIDPRLQKRHDDERRPAAHSAQARTDRSDFSTEFTTTCEQQVRPAMEAILERLRRSGGGGVIEEGAEDKDRRRGHRLTLWMSLNGEIDGPPRQDRHPYLQLGADVDKRSVVVSEGDMGQDHDGNRSGKVGEWRLSEITAIPVTQQALAILRRSVRQRPA